MLYNKPMPAPSPSPTKIEPLNETEILLAFQGPANDPSEYAVSYADLRYLCPCANCVDEHTGARIVRREQIRPGIKPTGVQLVGRYAVQISWNDRHDTGMYHYDRLYEISQQLGRRLK